MEAIHSQQDIIEELRSDREFLKNVTSWEHLTPREGEFAPLPEDLDPGIRESLRRRGIERLYTHQAEAYRTVREGKNLVIVTPTASGKTLSYNLPVLQGISEDPETRALYLFPTKALSQDQQSELNETVLSGDLKVKVATFDGDTPSSLRVSARETGQIVISNPDMLHSGILPNHPKWIRFFKQLRYVVIDEVHTYRGVFGAHMTNLLRRLKRVIRFYGNDPVFILCSATIGNPKALAEAILEGPVELIDRNGAPRGEKHFVLYNPPLVDRVQGIRKGVTHTAEELAVRFLKAGVKTIVFARSRVRTELIADYIRKSVANVYTDNGRINVESYRGGYLPNERRSIEKGLRDGTIQGVVSTNALELGIDIGGLDAAIMAGFPGSISSAWQQAGRAGRKATRSIAILVATASPLDQYMVRHPGYFFGRSPESAFLDPDNMYVLMDHLKCAVFELPFKEEEGFPGDVGEYLSILEEDGVVRKTRGSYYWSDRAYPAEGVSLRSATADNVVIVDSTGGKHEVIGEMDRPSAKEMLFKNAIYLHRGRQFVVTNLDLDNRRAYVEETSVNYFTDALVKRDIKVLTEDQELPVAGVTGVLGDVLIRALASKFKKIRYQSHENIGYGEIDLPEEELHTRAIALVFDPRLGGPGVILDEMAPATRGAVLARIGSLIQTVSPVFLLCERSDVGVTARLRDPHFGVPALYVHDVTPGGSGMAEAFSGKGGEILAAALELVVECPCEEGCPSCIGPRDQNEEIDENPKARVKAFLADWVAGGEEA
ncbi:MAG: DEAD/DEAH box helicase [Alkalispirochaetaceae bacterium]